MGTTLTALQAGSTQFAWVAAIEGYSILLTDYGTPADVVTAWSGSDWADAIGGLFVDLDSEQSIEPWNAFANHGGRCMLSILPSYDSASEVGDQVGIDLNKRNSGDETFLSSTADQDDTTLSVLSTAAFTSPGTAYIGTETVSYTGKTSTTFTTVTRGKYAPFGTNSNANRFAHRHRSGAQSNGINISPLVREQPQVWIGRWVGVWMHRISGGVLDTKAEAQLAFAGRIVSISDDPNTGATVIECEHMLTGLAEATLGRDMWSARIEEGVYIPAGLRFTVKDTVSNVNAFDEGNDLVVVPSGASGTNQMNEGRYLNGSLYNAINKWLAGETNASRINGSYAFRLANVPDVGSRTRINWRINNGSATLTEFKISLPKLVGVFLGFSDDDPSLATGSLTINKHGPSNTDNLSDGAYTPYRAIIFHQSSTSGLTVELRDERGTFVDQRTYLPTIPSQTGQWGIFLINNSYAIVGQ